MSDIELLYKKAEQVTLVGKAKVGGKLEGGAK